MPTTMMAASRNHDAHLPQPDGFKDYAVETQVLDRNIRRV
jgi:hypothetical protein